MTFEGDPARDTPSPDDIRRAVDRIVISDVFARSPQLAAFLRFVVEAVLHDRQDRIKAYTIGIEVLRRDVKFDPQLDPIVRVEATRLRRAIERYYAGPGLDDPLLIDLPRGGYVPTFRRRHADVPAVPARPHPVGPNRASVAFGAVLAIALLATMIGLWPRGGPTTAERATDPPGVAARIGNGMPTLALQRIEAPAKVPPNAIAASSLFDRLRDAFPRFDAINIIAVPPEDARLAASAPVHYRFFGSAEYHDDRSTTLRFRLRDESNGNVVWSHTFERLAPVADQTSSEEAIVLELAQTLLQPFGVIRAHERVKHLASDDGDPRYRCVIEASESLRSISREQQARARECLERLTTSDPGFAVGVRYLAVVELRDYLYGAEPADPRVIERALRSARRAVELQPQSSRSYHTLAAVLFALRDSAQAFAAGDRAVALNRYDMLVLGDYGGRLIAAGEVDRGMEMLARATGRYAVRPATHHFYLFLGSYLRGDLGEAAREAKQLTNDTFSLGLLARVLIAEGGVRQAALDRLVALDPLWRDNPRGRLERFFPAPAIVDRLARDLAAAGLGGSR